MAGVLIDAVDCVKTVSIGRLAAGPLGALAGWICPLSITLFSLSLIVHKPLACVSCARLPGVSSIPWPAPATFADADGHAAYVLFYCICPGLSGNPESVSLAGATGASAWLASLACGTGEPETKDSRFIAAWATGSLKW